MSITAMPAGEVPQWKEPTKNQWYAYMAAWFGWTRSTRSISRCSC